jgi:hypothetical protein
MDCPGRERLPSQSALRACMGTWLLWMASLHGVFGVIGRNGRRVFTRKIMDSVVVVSSLPSFSDGQPALDDSGSFQKTTVPLEIDLPEDHCNAYLATVSTITISKPNQCLRQEE